MVMDLTEPIPVIAPSLSASPERLLKLAIVVGAAGVIALIAAVIVLVWTITGVAAPVVSQQASVPADVVSKPVPAAPAAALDPEPAPAPALTAAPEAAPAAAPVVDSAGTNSEILRNPAMAAIAPTAPAPVSDAAPTGTGPTLALPNGDVSNFDWNDVDSGLQNAAAAYLWQNSGADATTGSIVGAGTAVATTALSVVGTNAGNLVNTLILANSGFYGGPGGGNDDLVTRALAAPAAAVSQIGGGVPSVPNSIGIPGTPIGTQIGPPQLGPPQLPQIGPPSIGIPGTPIGTQIGPPQIGPPSIGIPGTPIGTQIGPPQIGPPHLGIGIPGTPIGIGF
jgi:hypothetical protein